MRCDGDGSSRCIHTSPECRLNEGPFDEDDCDDDDNDEEEEKDENDLSLGPWLVGGGDGGSGATFLNLVCLALNGLP